ncbi:hypothetical protein ANCCEY_01067 [Ancylostoma ceylanicum]|uniref:Flavodoxin-like domain-containing protein n=1 Tax=Ancylostoma ceylanicum TaxID=53326 RepID=A0A0D6MAY2_9BILA|nr:hypothetical protein ANCCEY_01067 [Ancylostoma ceylanicum]
MSFHPPIRPETKPKPPKQWYEELLENDEILLYFTASLGVILPGLVYVIYHKVHNVYMNYAIKKEKERLAEEAARSEVAVVSLCTEDSPAQRFLSHLESVLKAELVNAPKLWAVDKLNTKDFTTFKGFCIFVVETIKSGTAPPPCEWFLDWLEDVAADAKQKKKANFEAVKFAIVGFGPSSDGETNFNRASRTVLKRMKILGSKQIMNVALFDTEQPESELSQRYTGLSNSLLQAIDKNLPGAEESEISSESEFSDEEIDEEQTARDKKTL